MKEENRTCTWKNELLSGIGELVLGFTAMGIGFGIAFLLPYEKTKDIPAELFFLLGGVILFSVIGIVALTVHLAKEKKKNKDIRFIYNTLKNKYKLVLMLVTKSTGGETRDYLILKGKSSEGEFKLYKEGEVFHFSLECFGKFDEDRYLQETFHDKDEVIKYIENLMSE